MVPGLGSSAEHTVRARASAVWDSTHGVSREARRYTPRVAAATGSARSHSSRPTSLVMDPAFEARLKAIFDEFDDDGGGEIDTLNY